MISQRTITTRPITAAMVAHLSTEQRDALVAACDRAVLFDDRPTRRATARANRAVLVGGA